VTTELLGQATNAVTLAIKLVGAMTLFIGLMKVAEDGGLLRILSRALRPVMTRLFPAVPAEHPAMSAMILNIASNMMGLANAATPFGIRAMEQLDKLNGRKGTATNAMVLFLAINTSGLAVLPSGVIALRASLGSHDAAGIFFSTWFSSGCATLVGVGAAMLLMRLPRFRATEPPHVTAEPDAEPAAEVPGSESGRRAADPSRLRRLLALAYVAGFFLLLGRHVWVALGTAPALEVVRGVMSDWTLAGIVAAIVLFGWARGVDVYGSLVEGGKEGFQVALRIIPFLVAILAMVGMLRAAGGIDLLVAGLGPLTERIGMPAEALPMALLRPLSGSGAYGVMAAIMEQHGPDSFIGYLVSTLQGSTETTFYVLAVYFGAVGIKRTRHALPACLAADVAGLSAATLIVNVLFG